MRILNPGLARFRDFIQDSALEPRRNPVGFQLQFSALRDFRQPRMPFLRVLAGVIENVSTVRMPDGFHQ